MVDTELGSVYLARRRPPAIPPLGAADDIARLGARTASEEEAVAAGNAVPASGEPGGRQDATAADPAAPEAAGRPLVVPGPLLGVRVHMLEGAVPVRVPPGFRGAEPEVSEYPVYEVTGLTVRAYPNIPAPRGTAQRFLVDVLGPGALALGLQREGLTALVERLVPAGTPGKGAIVEAAQWLDAIANVVNVPTKLLADASARPVLRNLLLQAGLGDQEADAYAASLGELATAFVLPTSAGGAGGLRLLNPAAWRDVGQRFAALYRRLAESAPRVRSQLGAVRLGKGAGDAFGESGSSPPRLPAHLEEPHLTLERYLPRDVGPTLDPANVEHRAGTMRGAELTRLFGDPEAVPRLYYYTEGATPEPGVARGRIRYTGRVPLRRIYDLGEDAAGLVAKSGGDVGALERAIKEAGYAGYRNTKSARPDIVALFEPLQATHRVNLDQVQELARVAFQAATQSEAGGTGFGATVNLHRGNLFKSGEYVVEAYPKLRQVVLGKATPEQIAEYASRSDVSRMLQDPRHSLGVWYDSDTNRTHLGISVTLKDRELAIRLGRRLNEKAIGYLHPETGYEEIPLLDTGRAGALRGTAVVDESGRPKRVYHGTAVPFDEFDASLSGPDARYGPGFYFTEDPEVASSYAKTSPPPRGLESAENVRPVYLDIRNPLDLDAPADAAFLTKIEQALRKARGRNVAASFRESVESMRSRPDVTLINRDVYDELETVLKDVARGDDAGGPVGARALVNELVRAAGYDGLTHIGGGGRGATRPHRVWIAFDPAQIKSSFYIDAYPAGTAPPGLPPPERRFEIIAELQRILEIERNPRVRLPNTSRAAEDFAKGEYGKNYYAGVVEEFERALGNREDAIVAVKFQGAAGVGTEPRAQVAIGLEAFRRWKAREPIDASIFDVARDPKTGKLYRIDPRTRNELLAQLQTVYDGGWPHGPKIEPYTLALLGAPDALVIDRHHFRQFLGKDKGTEAQRALIQGWIADFAARQGVEGRQAQAALWAGWRGGDDLNLRELIRQALIHRGKTDPDFARLLHDFGAYLDESGMISLATQVVLARAVLGAATGAYLGDTWEDRARNALVGMGLGAAASPALVRRLAQATRDFLRAGQGELADLGMPSGSPLASVDAVPPEPLIQVLPATDAERAKFLSSIGEVLPDTEWPGSGGFRQGVPPPALVQVNWATVRDPNRIDELIDAVAKARPLQAQGTITHEQTRALARELGLTTAQVLGSYERSGRLAARLQAKKDLVVAARNRLSQLASRIDAMDESHPEFAALDEEFRTQFGITAGLLQKFLDDASDVGRALNILRGAPQEIGDVAGMAALAGKDTRAVPTKVLAQQVLTLPPTAQPTYFQRLLDAGTVTLQTLNWAYINSLLTTFEGGSANLLSNLIQITENPVLRLGAAGIGTAREGIARLLGHDEEISRVYWGEPFAQMLGNLLAVPEALVSAWQIVKGAESRFGGIAKEKPAFRPSLPESFPGWTRTGVDLAATLVELPNRLLLMGPDEFAKVINYRGEVWAQAYNIVEREFAGRPFAALVDESARERFLDIIRNPDAVVKQIATSKTEAVGDLAFEVANQRTLNEPLTGRLGSLADGLSHPLTRMLITPFFKVPVNLLRYNMEHIPVLGLAVKRAREDWAAGGERRDLLLAKWALGAALLRWASVQGLVGTITGGGPLNPDLNALWREQGFQPYAVRIGDKVFSYNRFDTLGALVGMAATYTQLRPYMREDEADEAAMAMVLAVADNMLSKTFLQGTAEFLQLVMSQRPQDLEKNRFLRNFVAGFVPSGARQIERHVDPQIRAVYSIFDEVASRVPGLSDKLAPRLNWLTGEPQLSPPGWRPEWLPGWVSVFSPVKVTELRKDPVIQEFLDNQIGIGPLPPFIYGTNPETPLRPPDATQGIALNAEQHYWYTRLAAKEKVDGRTQYEAIKALIESPEYKKLSPGPHGSRADAIHRVVTAYREMARVRLLQKFPDLAEAYRKKLIEQGVLKGGEAARPELERSAERSRGLLFRSLTR